MNQSTTTRLEIQKLKTLPPLSPQTRDVLAVINDAEVSLEKLAELLEKCPSLAARLIGLANSAYFGRCGDVYTVKDAVVKVLGLNVVRGIAVSILIGDVLDTGKCQHFQPHQYWFVSVLTAMLTQQLAMVGTIKPDPGIAYTTGLLSNLGLLALANVAPEELSDTLKDAEQSGESVAGLLNQRFGFNQYEAGGWLALRWQLPEVFQDVLSGLGNPQYSGDFEVLVDLIQVSARLAKEIYENEDDSPVEYEGISRLGISIKDLNRVLQRNQTNLEELRDLSKMLSGEKNNG